MGKIDLKRMILGGLLAGAIINVIEFVVHGLVVNRQWASALAALGTGGVTATTRAVLVLWGFLAGIVVVWLYAGIRPRYGPGPMTALRAALAFWILAYATPALGQAAMRIFPTWLMIAASAAGLVAAVVATMAGAWAYKERYEAAATDEARGHAA